MKTVVVPAASGYVLVQPWIDRQTLRVTGEGYSEVPVIAWLVHVDTAGEGTILVEPIGCDGSTDTRGHAALRDPAGQVHCPGFRIFQNTSDFMAHLKKEDGDGE